MQKELNLAKIKNIVMKQEAKVAKDKEKKEAVINPVKVEIQQFSKELFLQNLCDLAFGPWKEELLKFKCKRCAMLAVFPSGIPTTAQRIRSCSPASS